MLIRLCIVMNTLTKGILNCLKLKRSNTVFTILEEK